MSAYEIKNPDGLWVPYEGPHQTFAESRRADGRGGDCPAWGDGQHCFEALGPPASGGARWATDKPVVKHCACGCEVKRA